MIIHGINTEDISVVVQGAVGEYTPVCLASVRKYLPGAKIILSTWNGNEIENLDYDILVLNDDPGAFDFINDANGKEKKNNINRQLLSTKNGMEQVHSPYALKIRTDFSLTSADFLQYFGKYPNRNQQYSFFAEKLLGCTIFARNPRRKELSLALHPSDLFFFGKTEDLQDLFDISLMDEKDSIYFAHKYPQKRVWILSRFVPEQYLWVEFLKRHGLSKEKLPADMTDCKPRHCNLTEATLAGNFILLSPQQLGIECARDIWSEYSPETCFSHWDWYACYQRYCARRSIDYIFYRLKYMLIYVRSSLKSCVKKVLRLLWQKARPWGRKAMPVFKRCLKKCIRSRISDRRWAEWKLVYHYYTTEIWRLLLQRGKNAFVVTKDAKLLSSDNISVIVQGAISGKTEETLRSIRQTLPQAEVVLSTWEGSNVSGLDYDILVTSPDPGANGLIRRYPHKQIHNVNREIASTLAGIRAAHREFCLKIRSDMLLEADSFIRYYNEFSTYRAPTSHFMQRIMVNGTTTAREAPVFGVGDWWYLGRKKDMESLFDIPSYPHEDIPFYEQEDNIALKYSFDTLVCRFIPEVWIIYSWLRKVEPGVWEARDFVELDKNFIEKHQQLLVEEFICIEPKLSGIVLPKARNIDNACSYKYCTPFAVWYKMARFKGMIPKFHLPKAAANVLEQIYEKSPQWFDVENWVDIVKNYAKYENVETFDKDDLPLSKSDITFVVCGRIERQGEFTTYRSVMTIRRFFPTATILLGTWADEYVPQEIAKLCNQVFQYEHPKTPKRDTFLRDAGISKYNSQNDQRLSVSEAMKHVKTKYVVRMRTDFFLSNDNFWSFYRKWQSILSKRERDKILFHARLLVMPPYMWNPRMLQGTRSYMLSDCFQFGLTEDLRSLWDGELIDDEIMNYFEAHPHCGWDNPEKFNHRYNAEQYFFLHLLKKKYPDLPYPEWYADNSNDAFTFEYEKLLASNVIIGDSHQLGVCSKFDDLSENKLMTFERLLEIYLENVDPDNEICRAYLKQEYWGK